MAEWADLPEDEPHDDHLVEVVGHLLLHEAAVDPRSGATYMPSG
jgi:hypothetical protein